MTRHESTGTAPSLPAVRPNGPGYSLSLSSFHNLSSFLSTQKQRGGYLSSEAAGCPASRGARAGLASGDVR